MAIQLQFRKLHHFFLVCHLSIHIDWLNPTWQKGVLSELHRQHSLMLMFSRAEALRNNILIDEKSPVNCFHQQKTEEDLMPYVRQKTQHNLVSPCITH